MAYPIAESREIAAPAETVWKLVADLPRMGEWSPENQGGKWVKGAKGPGPGAVFTGHNKNGVRRWSTTVTVVECEPARAFEIKVTVGPFAVAKWRYDFEATDGGCRVTESWDDNRSGFVKVVARPMGLHDEAHTRSQMAATLTNLAKAAES